MTCGTIRAAHYSFCDAKSLAAAQQKLACTPKTMF
jgi:hypothetical protein